MGQQSSRWCCVQTKEASDYLLSSSSNHITNQNLLNQNQEDITFNYFISNHFLFLIKDKPIDSITNKIIESIQAINSSLCLNNLLQCFDYIISFEFKGDQREMEIKKQFAFATRAVLIDIKELSDKIKAENTEIKKEIQASLYLSIKVVLFIQNVIKENNWDEVIAVIYELTERLIMIRITLKGLYMYFDMKEINFPKYLYLSKTYYKEVCTNALSKFA